MRNLLIIISFLMCFASPVEAQPISLPESVTRALANANLPAESMGVVVLDANTGATIVNHNANAAMNPASVMKLVTTYAGLDLLGPAYVWKTEIHTTGVRKKETLHGDVVFKGFGDPKLNEARFWQMLKRLRARGVRHINGDVILDKSFFALNDADKIQIDEKFDRAYNVLPDALLLNAKAINFVFVAEPDGRVNVIAEPSLKNVEVSSQIKLDSAACPDNWRARIGREPQASEKKAQVKFSGSFSGDCGEKDMHLAYLDHTNYFASMFKQMWSELGGSLKGEVREGVLPEDAKLLMFVESPPLAEILRDINKWSLNVMARQLFFTLGAGVDNAPATSEKSRVAISVWLKSKNISAPELILENGSGLSRNERISAKTLGDILLSAWRSPVMPEFISSLPISGADGTMKKRLNGNGAGRAHIKTGTIDHVKTMAGFVLDNRGRRMIVVSFANHANAASAQAAEDALLQWLMDR